MLAANSLAVWKILLQYLVVKVRQLHSLVAFFEHTRRYCSRDYIVVVLALRNIVVAGNLL